VGTQSKKGKPGGNVGETGPCAGGGVGLYAAIRGRGLESGRRETDKMDLLRERLAKKWEGKNSDEDQFRGGKGGRLGQYLKKFGDKEEKRNGGGDKREKSTYAA